MSDIRPTHSCFDDALDYMVLQLRENPGHAYRLVIVHALIMAPAGTPRAGEVYAHAWCELDGAAWQAGIVDGVRVWYAVDADEYRRHARPVHLTRYSVIEALHANRRTGHYGPWDPMYAAFCNDRPGRTPAVFGATPAEYRPKGAP